MMALSNASVVHANHQKYGREPCFESASGVARVLGTRLLLTRPSLTFSAKLIRRHLVSHPVVVLAICLFVISVVRAIDGQRAVEIDRLIENHCGNASLFPERLDPG